MGNPINPIQPYKEAYVYHGPNDSYVIFSYYSNFFKKYEREKIRLKKWGLSPEYKAAALDELCRQFNIEIKARNKAGIFHEDIIPVDASGLELESKSYVEWVNVLLDEKHEVELTDEKKAKRKSIIKKNDVIAESTKKTIRWSLNHFEDFLNEYPALVGIKAGQLNNSVLKQFLNHMIDVDLAPKSINLYMWGMQVALDKLHKKGITKELITTEDYRVKLDGGSEDKFRPLTSDEKNTIFKAAKDYNEIFYLYILCIYYTCIRPVELRRLTAGDLDFNGDTIFVASYNSKNGLSNYVQMLAPLKAAFIALGYDKLPKDTLLFANIFDPEKEKNNSKHASRRWRNLCRANGIDDTAFMYGLKHTFNRDYVENNKGNIDWEWLRRHNRHATIQQTQEYISAITAYFLDEAKAIIIDYTA